jgi:diguanylate cyclase (GGDEF)-like protein
MTGSEFAAGRDRATLVALTAMGLAIDDRGISEDAATTDVLRRTSELLDADVTLWWSEDAHGARRPRPPIHAGAVDARCVGPDDAVRQVARLGVPQRITTGDTARFLAPVGDAHEVLAVLDVRGRPGPFDGDPGDLAAVIAIAARLGSSTTVRRLIEALQRQADTDELTGLPNRALLLRYLDSELLDAAGGKKPPTVVFVDIDRFKDVNDSMGHHAGDEVLRAVAARLRSHVRAEDLVARFGGDEFVLVLGGGCENDLAALLDRITSVPSEPQSLGAHRLYVTLSAGVAAFRPGSDAETMLRHADAAMYRAKANPARRWADHSDVEDDIADAALRRDGELVEAIERGQLFCEYQQIVDPHTLEVQAHEALVRWNHPTLGRLEPGAFIPTSERTGLVVPLGAWVLDDALRAAASWPASIAVSVNVSARQVADPRLANKVLAALERSGVDPARLIVEITETVVMDDPRTTGERLTILHDAGVRLALDDFGTGFTSIDHVRHLPVDIIKIDRSFAAGVSSERGLDLLSALHQLATALGVSTIAEGIETEAQLCAIREIGFSAVQGFHLARPAPADRLAHVSALRGPVAAEPGRSA